MLGVAKRRRQFGWSEREAARKRSARQEALGEYLLGVPQVSSFEVLDENEATPAPRATSGEGPSGEGYFSRVTSRPPVSIDLSTGRAGCDFGLPWALLYRHAVEASFVEERR